MDIKEIEKIENIEKFIDAVNFYTPDEAKRCRILLARLLRCVDRPLIINKPSNLTK